MKKIFSIVIFVSVLVSLANLSTIEAIATETKPKVELTQEQKNCIKEAKKEKSSSLKVATKSFQEATKDALKIKQDAIKVAQGIKDAEAKAAAIKAANNAFNNNEVVKQAKIPYDAVIKATAEKYRNDVKECLGKTGGVRGFFRKIGEGTSNLFSNVGKFLLRRK